MMLHLHQVDFAILTLLAPIPYELVWTFSVSEPALR